MPTLDPGHPTQYMPNHPPPPMANPYAPSRSGPPPGPSYGRLPPAGPQVMPPPPHRVPSGHLNPAGRVPTGPLKSSGPSAQYLHPRPHPEPLPPGEPRQPPAYPEPPRYPGPLADDPERHHGGPKHDGRGEDETGRHSLHAQLAELRHLREAHQRLTDDNQVSLLQPTITDRYCPTLQHSTLSLTQSL